MTGHEKFDVAALLKAKLAEIDADQHATADDRKPVALDQQSVGRLSRMDAMQVQAMAEAQERRRRGERNRIELALERLATGDYGYCVECGEEIGLKRLEFDPAIQTCIKCAGRAG
ncbi:MAG: TraR/DksA C4-type zinc finger protein [Rhodospirillales bacterium]|nr:TraR/DksA C4-type zinc finger protein [Rhodospirillales bacterium]